MLSLLLTLSLGQVSIWPPINTAPYGFDAPLEPIRMEGPPAMLRRGTNLVAVWADRRRGLDSSDAGLDVWAGTWTPGGGPISQALLTAQPRPCGQPRLLAEPTANLTAAWVCQSTDGGAGFIELTTTSTGSFSQFPVVTIPNDTGAGPIHEFTAASTTSTTMLAARRQSGISVLTTRPFSGMSTVAGTYRSMSFVEASGGLLLLTASSNGNVTAYSTSNGPGPQLASNAAFVVGIPTQPESTFVYQAGSEVRLRLPDSGVVAFGTNSFSIPPLVARNGADTFAIFRGDGGIEAKVIDQNLQRTGTVLGDGGLPLSITGTSLPFTIAELVPGEVVLRDVSASGSIPQFSSVVFHPFLAAAPQQSAAAAWSSNDVGFITVWDQRTAGSWVAQSGLIDNGSAQQLAVLGSDPTPTTPSVSTAPDGGLYVAMNTSSGRGLFELIGGTRGTRAVGTILEEVVIGNSSYFTWSPSTNVGRHSSGASQSLDFVRRGCVAWWGGTFWSAPASGRTLNGISETGATVVSTIALPSPPMMVPSERCLTISETGTMMLTVTTPNSIQVHDLASGRILGPASILMASESPAVVGIADGVVAVVATVADGAQAPLKWVHFGPGFTSTNSLTEDTQPVRNVRAARGPNGDVLATWETFELDAGAWRVQARIIHDPPFTPDAGPDGGAADAGAFDAGAFDAGAFDAGAFDAGAFDAGSLDAGAPDAGSPDGGVIDAGLTDAGAPDSGITTDAGANVDAGPEPRVTFVPVCGCSGAGGFPVFAAAVLLLLRRLRGLK